MSYDIIIKNGLYFDGSGTPGAVRHVGIRDGRIVAVIGLADAPRATSARAVAASGSIASSGRCPR